LRRASFKNENPTKTMHHSINKLCTALDMLQLSEMAFARGEAVDVEDFMRRKREVITAARAARPALECLKAGITTTQSKAVAMARGEYDRARMEVGS
jgi:hypothetical protein